MTKTLSSQAPGGSVTCIPMRTPPISVLMREAIVTNLCKQSGGSGTFAFHGVLFRQDNARNRIACRSCQLIFPSFPRTSPKVNGPGQMFSSKTAPLKA